jgi:hypothetical protein
MPVARQVLTSDGGKKTRRLGPLSYCCPGIVPIQYAPGKRGASLVHALKQRLTLIDTDFGQVLIDSSLDLVVCRHFMLLTAFLMKP